MRSLDLDGPLALRDAIESLTYWRRRRTRLPWHRRGARREAGRMVVAWERRVRQAALRQADAPLAVRAEAALLCARTRAARWARRAGVAVLVTIAFASTLAGASFALLVSAL